MGFEPFDWRSPVEEAQVISASSGERGSGCLEKLKRIKP
jgi:hypothetical protein